MFLGSPEGDVHDQATTGGNHQASGVLTGNKRRTHPSRDHCVPAPHRLFPKWRRKSGAAVFDHSLVAAPCNVDENIQPSGRLFYRAKYVGNSLVVRVIASKWRNSRDKVSLHNG